jgi:hypothetical protein
MVIVQKTAHMMCGHRNVVVQKTEFYSELSLQAAEKVIREGMGLRASQRKGEWKVGNTMDLIRVILEEWGGGTARSEGKVKKVNKTTEKKYVLYLNEKNVLWDSIRNYNGQMDDFIIKL